MSSLEHCASQFHSQNYYDAFSSLNSDSSNNIYVLFVKILFPSPFSRKRARIESSPSPRPSPKRATRGLSPADSDGYNSGEDKSERPIGRGQAKLHPQPLLHSPVCLPPSDSRDILFHRTHSFQRGMHLLFTALSIMLIFVFIWYKFYAV